MNDSPSARPPLELRALVPDAASGREAGPLAELAESLERVGAEMTVAVPGMAPILIGKNPARTRVVFKDRSALRPLLRRDHLALAEAYLDGSIDVEGDLLEVTKLTELFDMSASPLRAAAYWLRLLLPGRVRYQREVIGFHYDQPADFFLAWFDRWRSYSHGFYTSPTDTLTDAQARKLQYAIDALGLKPGMDVFDMGGGWGCFVEYAGLQGIRVHAITISKTQHEFLSRLIAEKKLPCTVERVDFLKYRPTRSFDGAVFMGTLEHVQTYERVTQFLARHLKPNARMYADFCAYRTSVVPSAFVRKYLWPGAATYVNVQKLVAQLIADGFNVHELGDDTLSYAYTVRDWADNLERARIDLARRYGEPTVRVFLLFLRASYHFLTTNRAQGYHIVTSRGSAPLRTR